MISFKQENSAYGEWSQYGVAIMVLKQEAMSTYTGCHDAVLHRDLELFDWYIFPYIFEGQVTQLMLLT